MRSRNYPAASYRVNPLNPRYLPNTSYAREYAQAIISNLMKESIKKPDFWTRSATDLLTACIWYLKEDGRVASSKTAEILSKQFGKADKVYITSNEGRNTRKFGKTFGRSETIQERDVIKPSEFLNLQVGEFAGLAVESNKPTFRTRFKQAQRPQPAELHQEKGFHYL